MKKAAVVFKSKTGNTEMIAQTIAETLEKAGQKPVYFGAPDKEMEADLYFVGSWTDKGMCDQEIADFLKKLDGKKIAYFGTAGFGESGEYFEKLFHRAMENVNESNEILGSFFCQGKMPPQVREKYVKMLQEHPDDKRMKVSIENFDKAKGHPDENDCAKAAEWTMSVLREDAV